VRFEFSRLPGKIAERQPVVPVRFPGLAGVEVPALVDSGAIANRFDAQYGEQLGLDLSTGRVEAFDVAAARYMSHVLPVQLTVGRWTWEAPVAFVENWNHGHGILGLRGFFDQFVVRFDAAHDYCALTRRRPPQP
jgi:hypothetical protein